MAKDSLATADLDARVAASAHVRRLRNLLLCGVGGASPPFIAWWFKRGHFAALPAALSLGLSGLPNAAAAACLPGSTTACSAPGGSGFPDRSGNGGAGNGDGGGASTLDGSVTITIPGNPGSGGNGGRGADGDFPGGQGGTVGYALGGPTQVFGLITGGAGQTGPDGFNFGTGGGGGGTALYYMGQDLSLTATGSAVGGAGGAGGAGTASVVSNSGGGGGGGTGIASVVVGAQITNNGVITGGRGGDGAGGGFGGGGGGGGDGLLVLGGNSVITNTGTITGGVGGTGGTGSSSGQVGSGSSGTGVNLVGSGSILMNAGAITGGAGNNAAAGAGVITDGNATITNGGTISGGLYSDGLTRGAAIHFQGTGNTLNLLTGSNLVGSLDLAAGANATIAPGTSGLTLGTDISLGSAASAVTFDTGTAGLRAAGVITGSGTVTKAGSNTLTLTGTNSYSGGTTISGGTLQVGDGGTSGTLGASNVINNATLAFNRSDIVVFGGAISGSGGLTQTGSGTLILTAANNYAGGTTIAAGSTLQIGNGGTTGTIGTGAVTNNGVLQVNRSGTSILSSAISGSGTFRQLGTGITILTGANTYSGGTTISAGTLQIGNGGTSGSVSGNILNNAALAFNRSDDLTYAGNITGSGALTKAGAGTLTLTGTNTYTGGTAVNGGTLAIGTPDALASGPVTFSGGTLRFTYSGTLDRPITVSAGGFTVDTNGNAQTMSAPLTGSGAFTKTGSNSLNLTGNSPLTGATFVQGGRLAVNGSLGNSQVNVQSGGTLGGNGTVGGIVTQSGGIVAPGNSIGTLNVAGNVTFGPGSFYDVEINGAGQSDRIAATGIATLNGGTVRIFADQGQYSLSPYTILTADGSVTGKFEEVEAGNDFAFLTPTLGYEGKAVTLTLVRKTDPQPPPLPPVPSLLAFHTVAVSGNQYRTADAVEALGDGNALFDTVVGASANGVRQAFDALSGEAHASAVTSAYADMQRVQDTILSRLRNGALAQAGDVVSPTFDQRTFALWGTGFGSWGKVSGNAASMDTSTGGFLMGAEANASDTYRIGLTGGFMSTSFDIDGRLSSGTDETVFGSIYGAAQWDAINVRLGALYAHHDVDVNRTVAFPGFGDRVGSSYDGSTLMAFGEVGYEFALGRIKLEPFLGASVMRLHRDGFREEGGPAALVGYGRTYELGTTTLGLRAEAKLGLDLPLTVHGMVGWRHAFGDVDPSALLAFSGGASAFTVAGIPIDRDALVAEAGLDWQIAEDMTLGVSYAGQVSERAQEHAVKGNFTWRFETR